MFSPINYFATLSVISPKYGIWVLGSIMWSNLLGLRCKTANRNYQSTIGVTDWGDITCDSLNWVLVLG